VLDARRLPVPVDLPQPGGGDRGMSAGVAVPQPRADARDRGLAVGLTGEQEEAVERRQGALLLAANAGSGKTTVLVERFVRAVHDDGVAPGRILAITFTERAAGELRERVRRRLHELGDRAAARETEAAFVSTIHGFCARLLRSHPLAAGLAPGFGVLDEGMAAGLRQEAFERALADWMTGQAELDLAAACGVDGLATAIARAHDELRSRGVTRPVLPAAGPRHDEAGALGGLCDAAAVLARELSAGGPARVGSRVAGALDALELVPLARVCRVGASDATLGEVTLEALKLHRGAAALKSPAADDYEAARARCCEARDDALGVVGLDALGRLLEGFADEFAAGKRARGALDFDDLELCARDLLIGESELRERWSERFELLMVDELQDTNPREMSILAALDRGNLFTVGDEFQSIYGFRHADVEIFRARRRELAREDGVRALSRNFRSRPQLLAAINATFAPLFGEDFVPLVAGRDGGGAAEPLFELMLSDTAGWQETAPGEEPGPGPPWRRAEAALLARRIDELIVGGSARPGEIVVLLRYATAAGVYGQALAERGIPVAAALGGGFYAAQEIADLGAYARVLANPLDDVALYGVLASPLCGLRADGLAVIGLAAQTLGRPPWEVIAAAPSGDRAAAAELAGLSAADAERLASCRALIERERRAAAGLGLAELLHRSGYRERALGGPAAALGLANLRKLLRLAREFEAREGRDLRGFADRLAAGRLGSSREQHAQLAETDAVRLMTVHAAKGLEFPVVCVADLGHGPPIGAPVILTDGDRIGLRLPTLDGGKPAEAFAYTELRAAQGRAALAEEQRIAYVAMTRARERLILSGAAHFAHWPTPGPFAPQVAWLARAMVCDLADRLAGPTGVSELDLGGARVRLTLTAAGDMPALRDIVVPGLAAGPPADPPQSAVERSDPSPADPQPFANHGRRRARQRGASVSEDQISLFADAGPVSPQTPPGPPAGRLDASPDARLGPPVGQLDPLRTSVDSGDSAPHGPPAGRLDASPDSRDARLGPPVGQLDPLRTSVDSGDSAPHGPPVGQLDPLRTSADSGDSAPHGPPVGRVDPPRTSADSAPLGPPVGRLDPPRTSADAGGSAPPGSAGHFGGRRASVAGLDALAPADHQAAAAGGSAAPADAGSRPSASSPVHVSGLPPPSSLSYSLLGDHGRCGYGYYLRRVLGLPAVPPPPGLDPGGYDAAQRGVLVHGLLERLDFARPAAPSPADVRAQAVGREPGDEEIAAVAELVGAFARSPLCARLAASQTAVREAAFAVAVGDLLVNGYIDVLAAEAGGAMLVVDYKTDRIDADTDLAERVDADYAVQRQIYALAGLRAGASAVEVAYCFLRRPAEVVAARYTEADVAGLEAGLIALAGPLLAGRFEVSARPHRGLCATCPGRARLCSWEEALTLGEDPLAAGRRQGDVQDA
jgi:ATP-dependent helicase/nuclease subunit A